MAHGFPMASGQGSSFQDGLFAQGGGFLPYQTLNQESFENGSLGVLESARKDGILGALRSGPGRSYQDGSLGDSAAAQAAAAAAQNYGRQQAVLAQRRVAMQQRVQGKKGVRGFGDDSAVTVSLSPTAVFMGLAVFLGAGFVVYELSKSKRSHA